MSWNESVDSRWHTPDRADIMRLDGDNGNAQYREMLSWWASDAIQNILHRIWVFTASWLPVKIHEGEVMTHNCALFSSSRLVIITTHTHTHKTEADYKNIYETCLVVCSPSFLEIHKCGLTEMKNARSNNPWRQRYTHTIRTRVYTISNLYGWFEIEKEMWVPNGR